MNNDERAEAIRQIKRNLIESLDRGSVSPADELHARKRIAELERAQQLSDELDKWWK